MGSDRAKSRPEARSNYDRLSSVYDLLSGNFEKDLTDLALLGFRRKKAKAF